MATEPQRWWRSRTGARALHALVAGLVLAFVVSTVVPGARPADGQSPFWDVWIYCAIGVGASVLCLLRAVSTRRERLAWLALGSALAVSTWGDVVWIVESAQVDEPPFPSLADPLYLAFYPLAYVGLVLLVRARVSRFQASMWLDGLGAGMAVSALVTALVLQVIVESTGGDSFGVVVALAYPVADLLLILLVVGVLGFTGWRPDWGWLLVGAGMLAWGLADSIFLYQSALGSYQEGTPLDALWPLGALAIASAAWQRARPGVHDLRDWMAILVPSGCTLLALGVLVAQAGTGAQPLTVGLAAGAICASVGRTFLTFAEVRALTAQTKVAAWTDELTGLPNRRAFLRALDERLRSEEGLALLILDLDRFKAVNDTLGHACGDAVLREVGPRLRESRRDGDFVGRIGGDEFAILLPAPVDEAAACVVADQLVAAVERPFVLGGGAVAIGGSVGIALHPRDAMDATGLLRHADVAMYTAKRLRTGVESLVPEALPA